MAGRRVTTLHLLLACALLAACGDSTGPQGTAGTFTLISVNGSAPPSLVGATPNCDQYIASGTGSLALTRDFELSGTVRFDCTRSGGAIVDQPLSLAGSYALHGQQLTFTIPGVAAIPGRLVGDTLSTTIPASQFTFPVPVALVFVRVVE